MYYVTVKVNGRNRILFVKANSKSKNHILYIKSDKEYITYKSFLRKSKVKGGGTEGITEDITKLAYDIVLGKTKKYNNYKIKINYKYALNKPRTYDKDDFETIIMKLWEDN
jgi:hypothetical protein